VKLKSEHDKQLNIFMKIIFLFPTQRIDLDIELVKNPGIKSWARHFRQGFLSLAGPWDYSQVFHINARLLQQYLDICNQRIRQLQSVGIVYQGPMAQTVNDIDRQFTNQLHRFFTHSQQLINSLPWPEIKFQDQKKAQPIITKWLQEINDSVHKIELYLAPVPQINAGQFKEIRVGGDLPYDDHRWWPMNPKHRKYHSAEDADVVFGPQVLGKTLLRSYMDGDNPNDWDTTGHYANLGSLDIQIGTMRRKDIYNSDHFKNWLSHWGMTPKTTYYDYPVGNIINKEMLPILEEKLTEHKTLVRTRYQF
jgi:hypothetical protein